MGCRSKKCNSFKENFVFINSLKGKFSMCPTELIHPKHASLRDNIYSSTFELNNSKLTTTLKGLL